MDGETEEHVRTCGGRRVFAEVCKCAGYWTRARRFARSACRAGHAIQQADGRRVTVAWYGGDRVWRGETEEMLAVSGDFDDAPLAPRVPRGGGWSGSGAEWARRGGWQEDGQ
jgi:hypothetical protein